MGRKKSKSRKSKNQVNNLKNKLRNVRKQVNSYKELEKDNKLGLLELKLRNKLIKKARSFEHQLNVRNAKIPKNNGKTIDSNELLKRIVVSSKPQLRKNKKITKDGIIVVDFAKNKFNSILSVESALTYLDSLPLQNKRSIVTFKVLTNRNQPKTFTARRWSKKPSDSYIEMISDMIDEYEEFGIVKILEARIIIENLDAVKDNEYLKSIKAYGQISNRKYQEKCLYSISTDNRVCIYSTYLIITDQFKPQKGKLVESMDMFITQKLSEEPKELRKYAKNGQIHEFLKFICIRDKKPYYLYTFQTKTFHKYYYENNQVIIEILNDDEINPKEIVFYHFMAHVQPSKAKKLISKKDPAILQINKENKLISHVIIDPIKQAGSHKIKNETLHFYDIESYSKTGNMGILCDVTYDKYNNKFIGKHFDDVDLFSNYVDSISFKSNKKTRPNTKLNYHNFYAHNGANYDMIYIFQSLNQLCRLSKFIDSGNSIKAFSYGDNINFKDSNLMIDGALSDLVKNVFKLEVLAKELPINQNYYKYKNDEKIDQKESYPYTFYTLENKNYIGEVPNWKYFGRNDDSDEKRKERWQRCVDEHKKANRKFNLYEYTLYYCYLDCILGYKMIKKFQKMNLSEPEIICDKNLISDTRKILFKKYRTNKDKINYEIELNKIINGEKPYEEFKNIDMENDIDIRTKFLKFARKRTYFDPLHYKTQSSETMSRFCKLYNNYDLVGIQPKYSKICNESYGGGVTDVFQKNWILDDNKKIIENFKSMNNNNFNKFMEKYAKNNIIHKEDINSSYPSVMLQNVPIKCTGHKGIFYSSNFSKSCNKTKWVLDNKSEIDKFNRRFQREIFNKKYFLEKSMSKKQPKFGKSRRDFAVSQVDSLFHDTNLYQISYKYIDNKMIPNIYTHKNSKYMAVQSSTGEMVWGNIIKQSLKEHILNDQEKHGCDPRFEYFHINGWLNFISAPVFNEYISMLYEKRRKVKDEIYNLEKYGKCKSNRELGTLNIISKSLKTGMNSLYGKMGQKMFGTTDICNLKEFQYLMGKKGNQITNIKHIPGFEDKKWEDIFITTTESFGKNINAIGHLTYIASFITSGARKNLFDMIYEVGVQNCLYCDTDSLIYKGKRLKKIDPAKLGWLDSEINENIKGDNIVMTKYYANAPKFYATQGFEKKNGKWKFIEKKKSKGVGKGKLTFNQYEDLNTNKIDDVSVNCVNFERKMLESKVIVTDIVKRVKVVLNKRNFKENENRSTLWDEIVENS